jgi:hypothetical protein
MSEWIDLMMGVVAPHAVRAGFFVQRDAEDRILSALSMHGFDVTQTDKGEVGFRKTAQFGDIALAGEGRHEKHKPPQPYLVPDGMERGSRKYRVTDVLKAAVDPATGSVNRGEIDWNLFVDEGPTGEHVARNYYRHERRWRRYLKFRLDHPICFVCGDDLVIKYGPTGWNAADVHHLDYIAGRPEQTPNTPDRVVLVCCCCHAVHHRTGESIESLKERVYSQE